MRGNGHLLIGIAGISDGGERVADCQARHVFGLHCRDRFPQQSRRAADPARRIRHIVGVEDEPAITLAGFAQHAAKLLGGQRAIVELDDAQQRQIDDAGIDALVNAAAAVEAPFQLPLARQRDVTERVTEIGYFDPRAQLAQRVAIAPAFLVQFTRISRSTPTCEKV